MCACNAAVGSSAQSVECTHCINEKVPVAFGMISQSVRPISLSFASRTVYDSFPKASRHLPDPKPCRPLHEILMYMRWWCAGWRPSLCAAAVMAGGELLEGLNCFAAAGMGCWHLAEVAVPA
jgi:hypothetical protein